MEKLLDGKCVVLGITGSIAAYKIPNLARMLKKLGAEVEVVMTENATQFITPLTFESLTGKKCMVDTFDRNFQYSVEHVALAKKADLFVISPASANVIGKIAGGIADDMLTTTVMACTCPKIICPAMNHNMFHNPIVQDNIKKLENYGYKIVQPDSGMLANGDSGDGRMPEPEELLEYILKEIAFEKDLLGKRVLISAGATMEAIDPVRFITNHSTGKMGFAIARNAVLRGAEVTMVAGHTEIAPPPFVNIIKIGSAEEMFRQIADIYKDFDIVIMSAAVADFTPENYYDNKLKKSDGIADIKLKRTVDILKYLGENREDGKPFLCGFSMETQNLEENSKKKLVSKKVDMIVANSLTDKGTGFGYSTNQINIYTKNSEQVLPLMSKEECARALLDEILKNI